jgi:FkbM family methyltransferase
MILPLRALAAKYSLPPLTRVLHVGGHYGEECDDYLREGAERVCFFEPSLPSFLEMLGRLATRQGVTLVHCALGAFNGSAILHTETANAGQSSSLLYPKLHERQYPTIVFEGAERVIVLRLDDWMRPPSGHGWDYILPDFMAIDVQGYELEAFKGAEETLKSVQAISAEINREELYEGCALVGEVDAWLGARGFDRVETEWCGGSWGEAIYVRRRAA